MNKHIRRPLLAFGSGKRRRDTGQILWYEGENKRVSEWKREEWRVRGNTCAAGTLWGVQAQVRGYIRTRPPLYALKYSSISVAAITPRKTKPCRSYAPRHHGNLSVWTSERVRRHYYARIPPGDARSLFSVVAEIHISFHVKKKPRRNGQFVQSIIDHLRPSLFLSHLSYLTIKSR